MFEAQKQSNGSLLHKYGHFLFSFNSNFQLLLIDSKMLIPLGPDISHFQKNWEGIDRCIFTKKSATIVFFPNLNSKEHFKNSFLIIGPISVSKN